MKLHRINALLLKYFYISKNRYDRILDIFYWPLIDLLVWGFLTTYLKDIVTNFLVGSLIGGALLWHFFVRANNDIGIFVLEDFWSRNLYNLFSSPMKSSELMISIIIFALLRGAISFVILSILAVIFYSFNIFTFGIALVPFAVLLIMFGWSIGLFVSGLIYIYGQRIQVVAWSFGWLIQPFSAVFYPLASLPPWIQSIAVWLPTTHVFEGMRQVLKTGAVSLNSLGSAFVLDILFLFLAIGFFQFALSYAKKTGQLTRSE